MKKSERKYVELDLASIISAGENLRDTAPRLSKKGYAMFRATEEQPSLVSLALSDEGEDRARLVKLIEEEEPTVKELADNMSTTGQLEPIRVRPTEDKGKYDLVFGARRVLARLYVHAKSGGKIPAHLTAEITEQDDKDALYSSISENIRAEPSPIDEARSYERLRKAFSMTPGEIAKAMGKSDGVVRQRLKLLRLPKDLQEKVHMGKIGVDRALRHLEGAGDKTEPSPRKIPSLREIQKLYEAVVPDDLPDEVRPLITEEVRCLFAFWLGVDYTPRQGQPAA